MPVLLFLFSKLDTRRNQEANSNYPRHIKKQRYSQEEFLRRTIFFCIAQLSGQTAKINLGPSKELILLALIISFSSRRSFFQRVVGVSIGILEIGHCIQTAGRFLQRLGDERLQENAENNDDAEGYE